MANIRKPYYRKFRQDFYETLSEKGASILRYRGADNKEHYVAAGDSPDVMPGGGMVETTWQELKDKRDAGKLIPGSLYRITDYQCTTTQENTRSAGHQFDIVLLALSKKKLAEEGWAMMHENIYDVKFRDGRKKCYIAKDTYYSEEDEGEVRNIVDLETGLGVRAYIDYLEIDEENKKANYPFNIVCLCVENLTYNYFQNSNLSAWKIWYCLDNDKSRFDWADDSVDEDVEENIKINGGTTPYFRYIAGDMIYENAKLYAWKSLDDAIRYSKIEEVELNVLVYTFQTQGLDSSGVITSYVPYHKGTGPNGRGVVYRLIDEWNIDYPCDFKNMQILVPMDSDDNIDMQNPVSAKYCYVFTDNTSGDPKDLSIKGHAINIKVKARLIGDGNSAMYLSPSTLFYTNNNEDNTYRFSDITVGTAYTTMFINKGYRITILDGSSNVMLKDCSSICIGYNSDNIIFNTVARSTFGSNCQNIQLANKQNLNYGNSGVELATKDDIGNIETALNNI